MASREEHIRRAGEAYAIGAERTDHLIATGRADQAARESGCITDAEIDAWIAKWAPGQKRSAAA